MLKCWWIDYKIVGVEWKLNIVGVDIPDPQEKIMINTPIVHGKLSSGWHWSNSPNNPPHALSLSYLQFFTTVKWHNHTGISKTAYTFMFQYIIQNLRWTLLQYSIQNYKYLSKQFFLLVFFLFSKVRFWKASVWRYRQGSNLQAWRWPLQPEHLWVARHMLTVPHA